MLCFGAEESGFNVSLLPSKSKSFTWICLVQGCQVLFVMLATNYFCSSANLHDVLGNTTNHIPWPGEHTGLKMKTKYKTVIHRKEDKTTGRLLFEGLLFEGKKSRFRMISQQRQRCSCERRILEAEQGELHKPTLLFASLGGKSHL